MGGQVALNHNGEVNFQMGQTDVFVRKKLDLVCDVGLGGSRVEGAADLLVLPGLAQPAPAWKHPLAARRVG